MSDFRVDNNNILVTIRDRAVVVRALIVIIEKYKIILYNIPDGRLKRILFCYTVRVFRDMYIYVAHVLYLRWLYMMYVVIRNITSSYNRGSVAIVRV